MSKREEIKEIISEIEIPAGFWGNLRDLADKDKINLATDKILALAPFSKLERVREYCESPTYISKERLKIKREILSLISENEKAFDVREWLESNEKLFQRDNTSATWESRTITDGESYVFELGATYLQITKIVWSIPGKRIEQRVYLYKGSIPTSLYFWEMLLKSLGIKN